MKHTTKKLLSIVLAATMCLGTTVLAKAPQEDLKEVLKGTLDNGKPIEVEATLHGYIGTLELDLPVLSYSDDYTKTSVEMVETIIPVVRKVKDGGQVSYKILKGQEDIHHAVSYPTGYHYGIGDIAVPEGADISKLPHGFVEAGQFGEGYGDADLAHMMYFGTGLVDSTIYYETADYVIYAYASLGEILVIDEETEASFLKNGVLNEYEDFTWPGLKELLTGTEEAAEKPQTKPEEKPQVKAVAKKNTPSVSVNGDKKVFDAYTINDSNYFKLRDFAYVVNGSEKQFSVDWDGAKKAIAITTGNVYVSAGNEMVLSDGNNQLEVTESMVTLYVDGDELSFGAYNINGNTYFKLRDMGKAFNIGIGWDAAAQTVSIDTSVGYTE